MGAMRGARYDGVADWYDEHRSGFAAEATAHVLDLLVDRTGNCLEVGCGGGVHLLPLREHSWQVVGLDISADQLRVARARVPGARLVRADAAALPFGDGSFDAVVAVFVHTDLDDLLGAVREAARVLKPGGRFVHVGTHPCFVGPFSSRQGPDPPILYPGYRDTEWTTDAPGLGDGVRRRVGVRHVPLGDLLNAVAAAGLALERAMEPNGLDYPKVFALCARRL